MRRLRWQPMRTRLQPLVGVALAVLLLASACVPSDPARRQIAPARLKVVTQPILALAPLFIAQQEGFFAEQNLQVEFVQISRSPDAIPALAKGDVDVVAGTINVGLLNAIAQGAAIRLVADRGYLPAGGCPSPALLARRTLVESGELNDAADLRGRGIAMDVANFEEYVVETLLLGAGLTLTDVRMVSVPNPAKIDALQRGSVDVAVASEPWVTQIVRSGHAVVWVPFQEIVPDFQLAFVQYGPSLLEKNPDAGKRFMTAYLKAVRQYNQGKTERNLEILAASTELDRQFLADACWPALRDDGSVNLQSVLDFQAWAVKRGLQEGVVAEDQLWDGRFVDHANRALRASTP
jgi:NitT/TauT family transport system substrate-binding protein